MADDWTLEEAAARLLGHPPVGPGQPYTHRLAVQDDDGTQPPGLTLFTNGRTNAHCPGRTCLLAEQPHRHEPPPLKLSRSDRMYASIVQQVAAYRAAEERHADGTWTCPGCGRPYDDLPLGHVWSYGEGASCETVRLGRRMQCKDIPDSVFLGAVRRVRNPYGDATFGDLQDDLEEAHGYPIHERLVLAKARRLIRRGVLRGCACGCQGAFRIPDEEGDTP